MTAESAQAAEPLQASNSLREDSLFVVTGAIRQVSSEEVSINIGSNHQYHAEVIVETVEKSAIAPGSTSTDNFLLPDVLPTPSSQIDIYYWQIGQRPSGWTGPTGQNSNPKPGIPIRLFLTVRDGKLTLLEPNGWETLA
ncbi:MAG: hypothetical protein F6K11_32520 [Leptolyngbya sp. SIO3F4]|nr:hypothetical protein [Leptolyngbya sp. SIO3F4]